MPSAYQTPPPHDADDQDDLDEPRLAIRRWTDRCFFRVEEQVDEGFIVDGILIAREDVAQVVTLDETGAALPPCDRPADATLPGPYGSTHEHPGRSETT